MFYVTYRSNDFFETSIFLITFVILGRYLESMAKGKTSEAISKLISLQAKTATVLSQVNNETVEEEISIDLVEKGDIIKIVPGATIPTDGMPLLFSSLLFFFFPYSLQTKVYVGTLISCSDRTQISFSFPISCVLSFSPHSLSFSGEIVFGETTVNESLISGESIPKTKRVGDTVVGGSINGHGLIHIQATRVGSETTLSQIIRLVRIKN
jgi:Cu+-exporting ATPase